MGVEEEEEELVKMDTLKVYLEIRKDMKVRKKLQFIAFNVSQNTIYYLYIIIHVNGRKVS